MPLRLVLALLLLLLGVATDVYFYAVLTGLQRVTVGGVIGLVANTSAIVGILARHDWIRRTIMFYAVFFMLGALLWSAVAAGTPQGAPHIWLLYVFILADLVSAFYLPWCMSQPAVDVWFDPPRR